MATVPSDPPAAPGESFEDLALVAVGGGRFQDPASGAFVDREEDGRLALRLGPAARPSVTTFHVPVIRRALERARRGELEPAPPESPAPSRRGWTLPTLPDVSTTEGLKVVAAWLALIPTLGILAAVLEFIVLRFWLLASVPFLLLNVLGGPLGPWLGLFVVALTWGIALGCYFHPRGLVYGAVGATLVASFLWAIGFYGLLELEAWSWSAPWAGAAFGLAIADRERPLSLQRDGLATAGATVVLLPLLAWLLDPIALRLAEAEAVETGALSGVLGVMFLHGLIPAGLHLAELRRGVSKV